jgi:RimJ/RimL family protein N-acetyltransferase
MALRDTVLGKVQKAKDQDLELPVHVKGTLVSHMRMPALDDLHIRCVADWRERHKHWYPTVFPYNLAGTRAWIEKQVIANPERILFFLWTPDGELWGHLGLATFRFDDDVAFCEIDAVMRGRADLAHGLMTPAVQALIDWAKQDIGIQRIGLRVFADNARAIKLYERLGFVHGKKIPLVYEQGDPISQWREAKEGETPQRDFLVMELPHGT